MKTKKGFTFIEMIVVISVLLLSLPALFSIIFVILKEQTKVYRLSQVKREGDFALTSIENTLRSSANSIYYGIDQSHGEITACKFLPATDLQDNVKLCGSSGSTSGGWTPDFICFKDKYGNGNLFNYYVDGNGILSSASAYLNATQTTTTLVSNKMYVQNFNVSCARSADFSTPVVSVSFDICYNTGDPSICSATRPEETATLHYQTNIKLTSY